MATGDNIGDNTNAMTAARLDALAAELGDHFYIADLGQFEHNCADLLGAFTAHYTNTALGYSYKTNYLPAMCARADALGCYAEVVSGMEYALARKLGVPAARIIYNGPYKPDAALHRALSEGAVVNIDSLDETRRVVAFRQGSDAADFRVGLRSHPGLAAIESRFGLDVRAGDLGRAIAALGEAGGIEIVGLHCHVCPPKRRAEVYNEVAHQVIDVARAHFGGKVPPVLNLGGGFYSRMPKELASRWSFPIPTFEDYGAAIAGAFAQRLGKDAPTQLVIEPGVSVTADVLQFWCRVESLKTVMSARIAVVSGSVYNVKPTKNSANLPIDVIPGDGRGQPLAGPLDITGYTCMEDDVLYRGFRGELRVGDWIGFRNVGAYTNVLKPPFIRPAPAMATLDADGNVDQLLARPQQVEDVFAMFPLQAERSA